MDFLGKTISENSCHPEPNIVDYFNTPVGKKAGRDIMKFLDHFLQEHNFSGSSCCPDCQMLKFDESNLLSHISIKDCGAVKTYSCSMNGCQASFSLMQEAFLSKYDISFQNGFSDTSISKSIDSSTVATSTPKPSNPKLSIPKITIIRLPEGTSITKYSEVTDEVSNESEVVNSSSNESEVPPSPQKEVETSKPESDNTEINGIEIEESDVDDQESDEPEVDDPETDAMGIEDSMEDSKPATSEDSKDEEDDAILMEINNFLTDQDEKKANVKEEFACDKCSLTFDTLRKKQYHQSKTHALYVAKSKTGKCPVQGCGSTMNTKHIDLHIMAVHNQINCRCNKCKKIIRISSVKGHQKCCWKGSGKSGKQSRNKSFKCLICSEVIDKPFEMLLHCKKQHKSLTDINNTKR